ncbi:EAL domain-containing protein [Conexibacter sp. JD483]|uniref:putative bifunctional diguanylate cyclase/phosphodiesterase n=1 Tax=unclassified Conexibacter TaxID=2627773 RepID=UPI00271B6DE9|nr:MULTISPECIES: EAL domain-containing protein [unclassified Conexibacter]MDO8184006.1 EAL domain-containing protein [Conexibacter sp. CPCC 205706]MDO8196998.1 EAL domain-containing protein [Conexibacter sp. CPCC 205762]MDR9367914.1 EAL domain-containing protein [Conexibacter sp. JD483]
MSDGTDTPRPAPAPAVHRLLAPDEELVRLRAEVAREREARAEAERVAQETTAALAARQQELELLEAIAAAANGARTLEDALDAAVEALRRHGCWTVGRSWIADGADEPLIDAGAELFDAAVPALVPPPDGLHERAREDGEAVWTRNGFAFPVLLGERVLAVLELRASATRRPDPALARLSNHVAGHLERVAERVAARERIVHQTLHDALTGLPNRVLFEDRLGLALTRARRRGTQTAVLFLDVDRFKLVNDTLGHRAGDALLREVAQRLRTAVRASDTVARFGGDEFAVLCEELNDERDALRVANSLHAALSVPCELGGDGGDLGSESLVLSTSVGVAVARGREATPEELLRDADAAMYRAKELGRSRTELFDERLRARLDARLRVERELHQALDARELRLVYQPVVSLRTGGMRSVEALVRWDHPERGTLSPGAFLPIAEESGLIVKIGEYVLREACAQAVAWRGRLGAEAPLPIHVNLAARQLSQTNFVDTVVRILADTGATAHDIALEITESSVIENTLLASDMLRELKALGFEILLDDFGIGYSSLGYLQQLPIDVLKIDRSFIDALGGAADAEDDGRASAIVRAIVGMADALAIDVVAEGVETDEQARISQALGCDLAQGFLFARPERPETVEQLRRAWTPAARAKPRRS